MKHLSTSGWKITIHPSPPTNPSTLDLPKLIPDNQGGKSLFCHIVAPYKCIGIEECSFVFFLLNTKVYVGHMAQTWCEYSHTSLVGISYGNANGNVSKLFFML